MGGFSNFAISFSIISILTGAIQLFGYGLQFAGPVINTYGWPLVSVFVLCIAASMAELASAYPTAGGLYFWAHRLGGHRWAWVTAWFNMIGQITITAGIDYAAAITSSARSTASPARSLPTDTTATIVAMVIIMIPQVLINIFGIRLTAPLNDFSVYWHIGGVLVIAVLLTVFGNTRNRSASSSTARVTVNPHDLAATFAVGPWSIDSIMLRLPGCAHSTATAVWRWRSCSACCRRSGRTPATTPRRTSPRRRSWRGSTAPGACSCRSPCRRSSATSCCSS